MKTNEKICVTKTPQSFWMASTPNIDYPALNDDIKVDVAIIGGGISGILTGYFLTQKGIKAAIFEADHILQGTTGHTTAKVTSQHGLIYSKIKNEMSEEFAKQYADANESAIRMIEKISKEKNIECDFTPQSAYVYTLQDEYIHKIREEAQTASELGIEASYLEEIPLPLKIKAAVRFDKQAQFHPLKFLIPLAKKITNNGGQIFEHSRIVNIEEDNKYILTTSQGKKVTAEKVIIASHYPCYNKHGLYFARIYPERSYVTAIKAKENYPGGMYINVEEPGRSLRSQPYNNGELILVGGEHHKTGQGIDTSEHYAALIDFANKAFTVEDIPYHWSAQDCMTMDGLPYVGHFTSNTPNMYIATGFGKWGMTNSMASAMLLTDLILDKKSPWQEIYNPSRETIMASAKNFVVQNINVAQKIIEGKTQSLPEDIDVKPGEAKIIESDGQRTGAYRDELGTLHLVDTTCPHLGCELNWNSAEKSWDCPCHGSRFSYTGDTIEGPAVMPLGVRKNINTIEKVINEEF
jgi:glycine/D-amino acid oxidase-like deaminating enzyme/nitrite reductase/ring-hydroxylating ferredoxin subunit